MLEDTIISLLKQESQSFGELYHRIKEIDSQVRAIEIAEKLAQLKALSIVENNDHVYYIPDRNKHILCGTSDESSSERDQAQESLNGTAAEEKQSFQSRINALNNIPLRRLSGIIADYIGSHGPTRIKDLQIYLNKNYISDPELRELIARLPSYLKKLCDSGILVKTSRGNYDLNHYS